MHALGRVVDEERLVGIQGLLCLDPFDRAIGEIGLIVVVRVLRRRGASVVLSWATGENWSDSPITLP